MFPRYTPILLRTPWIRIISMSAFAFLLRKNIIIILLKKYQLLIFNIIINFLNSYDLSNLWKKKNYSTIFRDLYICIYIVFLFYITEQN